MSEVNGEGAYERRAGRKRASRRAQEKPVRKATARRRKSTRKAPARRTSGTRNTSGTKKASGTKRSMTANRSSKRPLKRDVIRDQMRKGRSEAQAEAYWRMITHAKKKSAARKKKGRTYGGKKKQYKALKAKAGRGRKAKTKWSYLYRTKKGHTRKIPDHALMGYSSAAEVARIQRTGSERERERLAKKMNALFERRAKAADRAELRALQGKAWFSPNAGDDVLDYEEWSKTMKRNARKKSTKKRSSSRTRKPKYGTKAYYQWLGKKGAAAKKRKSGGTKKRSTKRKSSAKRSSSRKPKYGTKAYYKWLGAKGAAARKRKGKSRKSGSTSRKRTTRKRSTSRTTKRDSAGRRITPKRRAAARRNLKKACRSVRSMKANRKGAYKSRKRSTSMAKRRSSGTRKSKSYKRNAKGAAFKQELMNSMKFGAIVLGGFVTHRLATNMLDKYVLSKISALNTGSAGEYRKTIGGILAALIGIPVTVRVLPKHAGVAAAGMAASLLYDLVLTGLKKAQQPMLVDAISAYPNAEGYPQYSGTGSYYTYDTHQVFDGVGSYYETSYVPGLEQAAAGMGAPQQGAMLTQAAAGMGAPQLQQMYANPMGEYYATGAEGIGEYESMAGGGTPSGYIDDGIHPNMHSAEQMLDVAEAAAGVGDYDGSMLAQAAAGFGDLPLESMVTPNIRAMDIPDGPGGSRAGILAGGDGIFG